MAYKSPLVNGRIPANQDCPFRDRCPFPQQGTCHHTGVKHPVDFSCASARLIDLVAKGASTKTPGDVPAARGVHEHEELAVARGLGSKSVSENALKKQARKRFAIAEILAKTNGRCYLCGDPVPIDKPEGCSEEDWFLIRFTRDHLIPRCQGGSGYRHNLWPAHSWCNERRHSIPIEYHRMFVLFRRCYTTVGQPEPSEVKKVFLRAKERWCRDALDDSTGRKGELD